MKSCGVNLFHLPILSILIGSKFIFGFTVLRRTSRYLDFFVFGKDGTHPSFVFRSPLWIPKKFTYDRTARFYRCSIFEYDLDAITRTLPADLHRSYVGTLLHERSDREPERVRETELVLQVLRLLNARVGVGPLVRADSGHDEQQNGHAAVGRYHPEPDERAERRQKREQAGRALRRLFVQYTDACWKEIIDERYHYK